MLIWGIITCPVNELFIFINVLFKDFIPADG
jgi:hypothetical protein